MSVVEDWIDGRDVLAQLRETFASPSYAAPKMPKVALELLALSQRADVTIAETSRVLERDAMLCGEVIKLIQSPLYAGRSRITSIRQALTMLGLSTVRDLVLQVATTARVFRTKAYQSAMDRLRLHATDVAYSSRIVCRYTSFDSEYAFLCGLLHDVGKAGALIALAEKTRDPPPFDEVSYAIDEVHAMASELMARQWSLPPEVSMIVGAHHTLRVQGQPHPLAAVVSIANHLANDEPLPSEAVRILGLSEKQLKLIGNEVEAALDTLVQA